MSTRKWLCVVAFVVAACQTGAPGRSPVAALDHVIVGVSDLEQGIADFTAATGVVPVRGGQHPGRGTENALVSLGNGAYLELIAPRREATDDPMAKFLRSLQRPTAIGWALQVKDAAAAHAYLGSRGFEVTPLRPGSRQTP
ncbi:MAG TPA: VOC family protein, partial [Thermoanaerobaculia bacterium]